MKVGDYVRFDGEIAKVTNIKRYKTKEDIFVFDRILDLNEDRACNDNTIYNSQWKFFDDVKSSPNIMDLIEVGDYVNGNKIIKISKDHCERTILIYGYDDGNRQVAITIYEDEIKSIVTKEQFESMEYKI